MKNMNTMKLERYCARCARENKQIKPEYLKDHGSPTYHPRETTLCPKHGIVMPLILRMGEERSVNLVSLSNETHDVIDAFVKAFNRQNELMTIVENKLAEAESRMSDLEDKLKKATKKRKKST